MCNDKNMLNLNFLPNITHSLKYQRSASLGCNDLEIWKLIFVIIAQLPYNNQDKFGPALQTLRTAKIGTVRMIIKGSSREQ